MNKTIFFLLVGLLPMVVASTAQSKIMDKRTEIAQTYYQILDNGDTRKMHELLAPTLIDHDGHGENAVEEIKGLVLSLNTGFSNSTHKLEVVELIGKDKVFIRWRMTALHTGEFFGVPASNKAVNFVGHDLLKIKDNKIVEIWHVENLLGMFEQMKSK